MSNDFFGVSTRARVEDIVDNLAGLINIMPGGIMINFNNDWDVHNAMQGNAINRPQPMRWRTGLDGMPAQIQQGDISTGPFNLGAQQQRPNMMPLGMAGLGLLAASRGGNPDMWMQAAQLLPMMQGLNAPSLK